MTRHSLDVRVFDYTWKQNRLSKDKEALKNSMLNVILHHVHADRACCHQELAFLEPAVAFQETT